MIVGAHCAARMRPTSVEPVKDRWRTTSGAQHLADGDPRSPSAVTTLSTPGRHAGALRQFGHGQRRQRRLLGRLDHHGQPAASAGATLRVIIAIGKFHGVMAAHTPSPA